MAHTLYTPRFDEEIATQMYMDGMMDKDIGAALGVSHMVIAYWRRDMGLPSNKGLLDWMSTRCRKCSEKCKSRPGQVRCKQ